MKRLLFFFLTATVGFYIVGEAQSTNYDVNKIPPTLLVNANAILRMDDTKIIINDIGNAIIYHKYAITILNEAGDNEADFIIYYDKFRNIESVTGQLFNANGIKVSSMKKNDLKDYSAVADFELINDSRVKFHNFYCKTYPYTIEYESEVKLKGIFYFPKWQPIEGEKFSVQNSNLTVQCPADYQLRYKMFNYTDQPLLDSSNNSKMYKWAIKNLPALSKQSYQPEWYELTPAVFLAPANFEIQNYKGNMMTWKDFGKFMYSLNEGRDQLPANVKQTVHSLTDTISDVRKKIEVLYKYMQNSTRYVAVELGIGGWQTFDANYVASNGYGDCKALSNYMCSLLKEAGIKSDCVLVEAGKDQTSLITDFPSDQFDHVIACVPLKTDTVWLECTSQTLPAGYLSSFTCNRNVLLVDEDGGKLVHTPNYNMNENIQSRNIKAVIDSAGSLQASIRTKYMGLKQDAWSWRINSLSSDKLLEYLKEQYADIPSYDIKKFDYKEEKKILPAVDESIELTADNYANVSGKRIFIKPDILTHNKVELEDEESRTCDIVLKEEYKNIDSVEIFVPSSYEVESVPNDISLNSKFGKYSSIVKVVPGKIIYYRYLECNSGRFPAADGQEFALFLRKIFNADQEKVVLVKNQ